MAKYIFILLFAITAFAQKKNLDIQDSLINNSIISIINNSEISKSPLGIEVEKHQADWMILQNAIKILNENNIKYLDSSKSYFKFYIKSITPEYEQLNQDSLIRKISLKLSYVYYSDGKILQSNDILRSYEDRISYDDIDNIQDMSYKFTSSSVPEPPTDFWDVYIEPVIVVSAAIVTVVLFFSVRSG